MKTQVIENHPFSEYQQIEAFRQSDALDLLYSPAKWRHNQQTPQIETESMLLGSVFHTAVLEPSELDKRYAVMPRFEEMVTKPDGSAYASPKASKAYKELKARFEAENANRKIIAQSTYDVAKAMADELYSTKRISKLFERDGHDELTIVWEQKGVRCKARIDRVIPGKMAIDLKSTDKAHFQNFQGKIASLGYHIQAAMYLRACKYVGLDTGNSFVFVVVESTAPYLVTSYRLDADSLRQGEILLDMALDVYKHCTDSDDWPGLPDKIQDITTPKWAEDACTNLIITAGNYIK